METTRLTEKLEIKVLEMCYGCQTIKITFDSETFEFMASYSMGDVIDDYWDDTDEELNT